MMLSKVELTPWFRKHDQFDENWAKSYGLIFDQYCSQEMQNTFDLYCLRYYIPKIVRKRFSDNCLGVGLFTMQGFERRNKETTKSHSRHSNGKGNVQIQTLKILYDEYSI